MMLHMTTTTITITSALILGPLFMTAQQAPEKAIYQLAPPDVRTENPPFYVPGNVTVRNDLVYSKSGDREVLADLYCPKSGSGPFPAVVYIHGKGLPTKSMGGTKAAFRRQAALLAGKGFVGLSIDYRYRNEAHFPGCIYDAKAAVRWLRANAKQYRIDPDRIAAVGGSWGGYLVTMLAATQNLPEFEGDGSNLGFPSSVKAVVAFNPAADPLYRVNESKSGRPTFEDFLGASHREKPELWVKASPTTYFSKQTVPILFLHGTQDTTAPYAQAQATIEKLLAAGAHAELFPAEGARHGFYHAPPGSRPHCSAWKIF
jgi:acetyl esterase/lipase